jgi:hypothetical protein
LTSGKSLPYKWKRLSHACSRWFSLGLALSGWIGCIRKPPPAPSPPGAPSPPAIRVPPGCLDDLSGTYVHALNPSYNYLGTDDGGTLFLAVERAHGDAGASRQDSNPISISLSRTPRGFLGETRAMVFVTSGRICSVDFPTELVGCEDGGLLIKSAMSRNVDESCRASPAALTGCEDGGSASKSATSTAVDESCRSSQAGGRLPMAEHRLIRAAAPVPANPADAGDDSPPSSPDPG